MAGLIVISAFSFVACIPLAAQSGGPNKIHFVKKAATGKNNGSNWRDAYRYLQDALAVAQPGDEIWVAEGVYHPDEGEGFTKGDREASFILIPGVKVIGGFSGRRREYISDPDKYASILSGDLNEDDGPFTGEENDAMTENSKFVVRASSYLVCEQGNECSFHLEAVTVQSSNMGSGIDAAGDPSETLVTLRNIQIRRNWSRGSGAGVRLGGTTTMLIDSAIYENKTISFSSGAGMSTCCATNLIVKNSVIRDNIAGNAGGGLRLVDAEVFISNSEFRNNHAGIGGAIYTDESSLYVEGSRFIQNSVTVLAGAIAYGGGDTRTRVILNSVFIGNRAGPSPGTADRPEGGGLAVGGLGEISVINCTFTDNYAESAGGAIASYPSVRLKILNSILWNNSALDDNRAIAPLYGIPNENFFVANSIVEGGVTYPLEDGGGNLDVDPIFVDPLGDDGIAGTGDEDLRLSAESPAIDAADARYLPSDSTDLDMDGILVEPFPFDYQGLQRILVGTLGIHKPDMGAFEYSMFSNTPARPEVAIQVYPNPARDDLFVQFSQEISGVLHIDIFDITGRRVFTDTRSGVSADGAGIRIDLHGLSKGAYILRLSEGGAFLSQPFFVT